MTFDVTNLDVDKGQFIRALVVDDDPAILKLIYNVMAKRGYEVEGCVSAESGLKSHQEKPFDLMILDWFLPGMDGLELCRIIRSLPEGRDVYILVITGGGIGEVLSSVLDAGASDYLQKPFEFEKLSVHLTIAERQIAQSRKRRRAEKALIKNEELLRDFMENAKDLIQIIDSEGNFIYANKYWKEVLGYSNDDFPSLNAFDVVHEESREFLEKGLEIIRSGKDIPINSLILKSKNGDRIEVEGSVTIKRDQESGFVQIQSIYRDVTQRKATEEELRVHREETEKLVKERTKELKETNEKLHRYIEKRKIAEKHNKRLVAALNHADEIIIITDFEGNIEYANPAFERITGYNSEEVLGKKIDILSSDVECGQCYNKIWEKVKNGEVWSGLLVNQKKDGTLYDEDGTISPIRDNDDNITNFVLVRRDVTQERRIEKQLHQAQKLESIGQLAAGIAHEINTPIQYIGDNTRFLKQSFSDLMTFFDSCNDLVSENKDKENQSQLCLEIEKLINEADYEFLSEEIPGAIEQSLEGIDRVAEIVRVMKEFSHPGLEEKTSIDINQALRNTVSVARNEWKYYADVNMELGDNLPPVTCFPGELNQVFLNLIVNAAHAIKAKIGKDSSQKGKITIRTSADADWLNIVFEDTGTGIPEEVRDKIFNPFFTTKDVGVGTGQGLSITHSIIVEKHKGLIDFTSEIDVGTSFTIKLPLALKVEEGRVE